MLDKYLKANFILPNHNPVHPFLVTRHPLALRPELLEKVGGCLFSHIQMAESPDPCSVIDKPNHSTTMQVLFGCAK